MRQGNQAVEDSVSAIQSIDEYSQQVTEIVEIITQIASQTNLLAMNAAKDILESVYALYIIEGKTWIL
jgi:methyl-accepting chemotaxis protein